MKKRSRNLAFSLLVTVLCATLLFGLMAVAAVADNGAATAGATVDTSGVLYGKTALFCGDSICAGPPNADEAKAGWAGRIGALYGMITTNNGRIAATVALSTDLSHGRKSDNRIINQIESVKNNTYDYVILHGGVNDAMDSLPVGAMTDSTDVAAFDNTTFAGALEELFARAKEYFGEKTQIGYIVNYQTPMSNWGGATQDMSAYVKVALQVCDKWNVSYLDLYDDLDFNQEVMKVSTKDNLMDFLHPNDSGYDLLAVKIGTWMETLGQGDSSALPWIIGAVVVVLVVAAIILFVVVRKKKSARAAQQGSDA
ncbi:MAG: SGNH/GDSL hydrolase family protein [Armatimonadetes bacterium]|nr:SGNH/GDSL hydrolase family protein [Armatimonadota bacterium]